jgi:hypothetical protein
LTLIVPSSSLISLNTLGAILIAPANRFIALTIMNLWSVPFVWEQTGLVVLLLMSHVTSVLALLFDQIWRLPSAAKYIFWISLCAIPQLLLGLQKVLHID